MEGQTEKPLSIITCPGWEDEEVHQATPQDKEDVLKIRLTPLEMNYMEDRYSCYTQGPGTKGYVLKKGGQAVGFFSTQLVDGGETLVTSAGRLLEAHRGNGFYGRAKNQVFRTYRGTGLRRIAMSLSSANLERFGAKLLKHYSLVYSRQSLAFTLDMAAIRDSGLPGLNCDTDTKQLRQLSSESELETLLSEAGDRLFPEGRMIFELKPFRAMKENVPIIFGGEAHERAFVVSEPVRNESCDNRGECHAGDLLFSCGSYYYCRDTMSYSVDLYATENSGSSSEVRKQLEWHLRRLVHVLKPTKAIFRVFFERRVDAEMAEICKDFPNEISRSPYTSIHVTEMEYEQ